MTRLGAEFETLAAAAHLLTCREAHSPKGTHRGVEPRRLQLCWETPTPVGWVRTIAAQACECQHAPLYAWGHVRGLADTSRGVCWSKG